MSKLDARLRIALQALEEDELPAESFAEFGVVETEGAAPNRLAVLVHYTGTVAELEAAGFQTRSVFQDVASGTVTPEGLEALAALESVVYVEAAYAMVPDLDVAVPEVNADDVHSAPGVGTPPAPYRGRSVIVGVIDSGLDYTHPAFRNADGTTRVLRIWDQGRTPTGTETSPPQGYGVEYTAADIATALAAANPFTVVRQNDDAPSGHGTHVAGIAAGNGRPAGTFVGVAPEADLIIVNSSSGPGHFGDSTNTADAIKYIFAHAEALNRPCVINMSLGVNVGAHDGSTLLERAIDQELGSPGRAFVKSAGNAADDICYTRGSVPAGGNLTLRINVPAGDRFTDTVDIWYTGRSLLSVTVTDPAGNSAGPVAPPAPGPATSFNQPLLPALAGGNRVIINSSRDHAFNRDNRLLIQLLRGSATTIQSGNWQIQLTNAGTAAVPIDAWIERRLGSDPVPTFVAPGDSRRSTISIPGTAREAITVASYQTKTSTGGNPGSSRGEISPFSSRGPTRDGRIKPDIAAPGQYVMSARASGVTIGSTTDTTGRYHLLQGTSMATPIVTGTVALILQKNPTLVQEQIRAGLIATARTDSDTGTGDDVPNHTWGYGKLDVAAAVAHDYPSARSRNWVRIRSELYNWTMSPQPPAFEIHSNENGHAVVELAWDPQAMLDPSDGYVPLRYYSSDRELDVTITKRDGSAMQIQLPEQVIRLTNNRARWEMPQALWDGYLEELRKGRQTPPASTMSQNLYYRVRFEATGATSVLVWPPNSAFENNPLAQRMGIIALRSAPSTQVVPDRAAVEAMGRWGGDLERMWEGLDENHADRQSLARLFSHRFFTNQVEASVRGKILTLWLFAGPSRQRLPDLLDKLFRTASGLEMTVLKQPDLRDGDMLVDQLLELLEITPHPDLPGVTVAEQLVDDVIREILDPNGQLNQGRASTCAPTGLQTLMINLNASEYVRLQRGLLSSDGRATLANGDVVEVPPGIFQIARYAGSQTNPFYIRTNSELAFQATILRYAIGSGFPPYDPAAPPNDPNGVNTVFQATIGRGLTASQMERALEGLFNRAYTTEVESAPSAALRNSFLQAMASNEDPLMLILHWRAPATDASGTALHAVVALRSEGGRIFFKNPQYAGSRPPTGAVANSTTTNPPRRYDDPTQSLESMGDGDLSAWIRWFHRPTL